MNNLTNKKAWSVEERQEMAEYVTLEFPSFRKAKVDEICHSMEKLGCTLEEAVELYEFDRGTGKADSVETEKKEVKKMTAQAKKELKEKKSALKKQADAVKEDVINQVYELLQNSQVEPQKVGTGSICFTGLDGQFYTLKLTKNKTCPSGYNPKN